MDIGIKCSQAQRRKLAGWIVGLINTEKTNLKKTYKRRIKKRNQNWIMPNAADGLFNDINECFGITKEMVLSPTHLPKIAILRHAVVYILYEKHKAPYMNAAFIVGRKTHDTAMKSHRFIRTRIQNSRYISNEYEQKVIDFVRNYMKEN